MGSQLRRCFTFLSLIPFLLVSTKLNAEVTGARAFSIAGERFSASFTFQSPLTHGLDSVPEGVNRDYYLGPERHRSPEELNRETDAAVERQLTRQKAWQVLMLEKHPLFKPEQYPRMYQSILDLVRESHGFLSVFSHFRDYSRNARGVESAKQIAFLAVATVDENGLLPMEKKPWNLKWPRTAPVPLGKRSYLEPTWIAAWQRLTGGNVYIGGDPLQINSLVLSSPETLVKKAKTSREASLWPLVWSLAYSHGLFSLGRLVPEGTTVEIARRRIRGPALILPDLFVGESDGAKLQAHYTGPDYGFELAGIRENPYIPGSTTSLLQAHSDHWVKNRAGILQERPGYRWVREAEIGPLVTVVHESPRRGQYGMAAHDPLTMGESLHSCLVDLGALEAR